MRQKILMAGFEPLVMSLMSETTTLHIEQQPLPLVQ